MEKLNMLRDGGNKLPPGLRFEPTDEEIVFHYLAPKIFSSPLPAPYSLIPQFHNMIHPYSHLPHSYEDRYFFANIKASHHRTNFSSSKPNGYWKIIAPHKLIRSKTMPIVGIKKTFLFCQQNHSTTHHCFMHLYCIALSPTNSSQGPLVQIGNWVLCHVYFKKKTTSIARVSNHKRTYDQLMTKEISDTDSSCASSSNSSSDSDSSVLSEVSSSDASKTDSLAVQSP